MTFRYHTQDIWNKFPALQQDQVFFDNAGGSQTLGTVIDSIKDYLGSTNVQLGASYAVGKKATAAYRAGYQAAARYINADPDEIVFGPSTTQLLRNLSYALKCAPGDEIVVSRIDHEANIAPWVDLAERQNLVLKWWRPTPGPNPKLTVDTLKPLITDRTRLVTCTHASNILGTITDVPAIADVAHSVGALLCVDAVAYAPHRPIDVKAFGVDFYCFSWYKVYGPHVSMLYGSWSAQTHLRSLGHFFNPSASLEDKLGLAGGSYELVQSIPKVTEYLGNFENLVDYEGLIQSALLSFLRSRGDGITIYGEPDGDTDRRVATVSFSVRGWTSQALVEEVEKVTNFAFRWGTFYSDRLVRETLGLGKDGVVRVSMVHYNTQDDVRGLIRALQDVLDKSSSGASRAEAGTDEDSDDEETS
ncbi:selenocysteine lyase [Trichoderma citrinoviride]|uniref:Selenocysteine lyase n=1 Tax=Trichoderma citrinoviride TaxID=58853 RepID=A0A2T4BCD9_9HYPO|nr:selenocysteine lyase [Trichoderma citrinoviride]PTB66994.1 selenocysteine lyase [Trichoderma citrinoviride]